MPILSRLFNLWHNLFHKARMEQELKEEIDAYLEMLVELKIKEGLNPGEARRLALIELGGKEQVKERVREVRMGYYLETLWQDLRYAARRLRRNPGFTAVSILTLALGIGASTAIFSAVNPILFEPLPYPQAGQVTMIWDHGLDSSRQDITFGSFRELAERNRSFEAIAVMKPWQPTITKPAERLDGQSVSASYFQVLGVPPALGRDFDSSEDQLNGAKVVILSNGLWQRRFGGDHTIIGRQIILDDDSYSVIGVMPSGFENVLASSAELWSLLQYDMSQDRAWGHHLRMVGRLRPGVATDQARQELNTIAHNPITEFPRPSWASIKQGLMVKSLQDDITEGIKPALLAILGAVILVLMIACVNVTNLLLAHGAQRRGEFAVRAALGAERKRMIQQLLTESLLLAALGGALGMVLAEIGVEALVALSPPGLPRVSAIVLDTTVFAFGLGITTLIGVVVGLIPALYTSRADLNTGLQQSSRRIAGNHQLTRRALVVVEIALALILLVSAGLLLRSLQQLFAIAPGFDASHLLTMQVQTSGHRFDDDNTTRRFFTQALEAVRRVPGVTMAAFTSQLPLSNDSDKYGVHFESSPTQPSENDHGAFRYAISPGYLETMHIPLQRGRLLDEHDRSGAPLVALINESYAKREFPGIDPIGQRLRIGPMDGPFYTIVGVVGDVKQASLAISQADAVYITPEQWHFADRAMSLVVRTQGDAAALAPVIRDAIWSVDKDQPIVRLATMDDLLATSAAERRFALILFEAFGIVALVLAATGIYGVLSGSVTERIHEIGVRLALGASRGNILALVVRQGMTLTGLGVVIGLTGAVATTQAIVALLFGISRLDPITYLSVIALLVGVSVIACSIPAWRAARVDPSITLRAE
ncbi:MAG: ABC transporter permease [Acidobacteriota bacterium]